MRRAHARRASVYALAGAEQGERDTTNEKLVLSALVISSSGVATSPAVAETWSSPGQRLTPDRAQHLAERTLEFALRRPVLPVRETSYQRHEPDARREAGTKAQG